MKILIFALISTALVTACAKTKNPPGLDKSHMNGSGSQRAQDRKVTTQTGVDAAGNFSFGLIGLKRMMNDLDLAQSLGSPTRKDNCAVVAVDKNKSNASTKYLTIDSTRCGTALNYSLDVTVTYDSNNAVKTVTRTDKSAIDLTLSQNNFDRHVRIEQETATLDLTGGTSTYSAHIIYDFVTRNPKSRKSVTTKTGTADVNIEAIISDPKGGSPTIQISKYSVNFVRDENGIDKFSSFLNLGTPESQPVKLVCGVPVDTLAFAQRITNLTGSNSTSDYTPAVTSTATRSSVAGDAVGVNHACGASYTGDLLNEATAADRAVTDLALNPQTGKKIDVVPAAENDQQAAPTKLDPDTNTDSQAGSFDQID